MTDLHDERRTLPARASDPTGSAPAGATFRNRVVRQVRGIDAWNESRRMRERLLQADCSSRRDKEVAARQIDALRRTQLVIQQRTAEGLAGEGDPMRVDVTPTAVIAHRQEWFARKLSSLLSARGVRVIACTDNAADALGLVIAEQPDLVLAGDRLAMMPGDVLLSEVGLFAAETLRALQVDGPQQQAQSWNRSADEVFLRQFQPDQVADVLSSRCRIKVLEHAQV